MKTKLLFIIAYFSLIHVLLCAGHYSNAVSACKEGEGTDSAIEETLYAYGYDCDAFSQPSAIDFFTAPFEALNRSR